MLTLIAVLEIGTVVAGAAAFFVIRNLTLSLKAYSEEKGKNLATKEDVAEITRKVESVRAEYAERLQALIHENTLNREATQRRHQLSMAALDKRLEAHQEAYYLWRQMMVHATEENNSAFFESCQSWWEKHCLYLSEDAENAFMAALHMARIYKQASGALEMKAWARITAAGTVIRKAAQLPALASEFEPPLLVRRPEAAAVSSCEKAGEKQ
jgi:hypothetical protein